MISQTDSLPAELRKARAAYLDDLQWLRDRFGVVPALPQHQVGPALWLALDALEDTRPESFTAALKAFRKLHRSTMKRAVWEVLEETRKNLLALRSEAPALFERKREVWNEASALFTNFNQPAGQSPTLNYRKALELLATL